MVANTSHFNTIRAPDVSGLFKGIGQAMGHYYGPEAKKRDLMSDPANYQGGGPPPGAETMSGPESDAVAGGAPPDMSAANLRPEAMMQLRGLDPGLAFGIEKFAQQQKHEAAQMDAWEREAKAREFETHAKWWGTLEREGAAIWNVYQQALAGGGQDSATEFKARARAQMAYESKKDMLKDAAEGLGVPLPDFFSTDEFRPEHFVQFGMARQELERKSMLMRVPKPGGGTQDVLVSGTPEELQAEYQKRGAVSAAEPPKGLPEQGGKATPPTAAETRALAKDYDRESEAFRESQRWLRTAVTAQDNSTGDQALTVAFARSLQPTGILSDADIRQAQAGDYPEILTALIERITGGGQMDDRKRAALRRQTAINLQNMLPDQEKREARTMEFAKVHGYKTEALLTPYASDATALIEDILNKYPAPPREATAPNKPQGGNAGSGAATEGPARDDVQKGEKYLAPDGTWRIKR